MKNTFPTERRFAAGLFAKHKHEAGCKPALQHRVWKWLFSVPLCLCGFLLSANAANFELRDGDRVAFTGGVFMERENEENHIETMLTRSFLDRNVVFRNLGWGGDTVETFVNPSHEARPKYVPTLLQYVETLKPTVLFVSYGIMESFRGEAGLPDFTKNYNALLDKLSSATRLMGETRFILVSPFRHEALDGNFSQADAHNKNLQLYVSAIEQIARERNYHFVNLSESLRVNEKQPLTSNGVHLNSRGYAAAAAAIEKQLNLKPAKLNRHDEKSLRAAIKHKNNQWWFHYRPMNSEYVYRNGTRFQDKIGDTQQPLDQEIAEFAKLAEKADFEIVEVRKRISSRNVAASRKSAEAKLSTTATDGKTPDPEIERASFQVAEGFEVNLFAADPLIQKPVQIAFDERGRLFVATTTLYPQIKPGEAATDKIIILEDKDGDGRADKTAVFADDLYIPTGVLPGDKGLYVFDDTTLLHLRDTNGDGRADEKEIILSGFGTEDSHHKGHVLRYSPGGNIYFNQGVFLHSTIETARGIVHHSGNWLAGIFEYQPASRRFEVYLANSVPPNPWGHYWNRWGLDFHIDSSGQQGSNFILPTANKTSSAIPVPGGEGKLAGGEIISGRHFPDDWQGNLIAAPFKENRVARWSFSGDGSGYAMKQLAPLIVSTDSAFRPVEMRMGPDGALYIADWYNPLIGHMQYHFRDPGRDFTHGRIWRVTAKNRPLVPRFNFAKASIKEVLEQLKAPEDYNRMQARRVLSERNRKDVLAALAKWVKQLSPADKNYDHQRLEALWTYQNLNVVESDLLKNLMRANEPNARAAATVVLRYWHEQMGRSESLELLSTLIADEHPRVRLQAVITLSHIPDARALEIAQRVAQLPMDKYLEQALKNTVAALNAEHELRHAEISKQTKVSLKAIAEIQERERKLSATAGLDAEIKDMTRAELEPWVKEVQQKGDPARGEKIFHRAELNCFGCHAIGGAGGQLGPELGAVGSGSTIDYLLEAILFPNKIIKDGYETIEVTTKDDDYILGVRVRENKDELVLRDATRNEIIIPTATIQEKKSRRTSLMPAGLAKSLTHAELIDLTRFLSELGKPGPYANNPKTLVRNWQIFDEPDFDISLQLAKNATFPWTTAYSHVSGVLPLETLRGKKESILARFEMQTTSPGKVLLQFNSIDGLKMWVNDARTELKPNTVLDLQTGTHRLTFLVNAAKRDEGLRIEVGEAPGSSARVHLAGNPQIGTAQP